MFVVKILSNRKKKFKKIYSLDFVGAKQIDINSTLDIVLMRSVISVHVNVNGILKVTLSYECHISNEFHIMSVCDNVEMFIGEKKCHLVFFFGYIVLF